MARHWHAQHDHASAYKTGHWLESLAVVTPDTQGTVFVSLGRLTDFDVPGRRTRFAALGRTTTFAAKGRRG